MSANTETTGADRAKCHPACGKAYDEYLRSEYRVMFFDGYIRADRDGHVYCSQACAAPPIAAPAAHVERRKGQRWHMRNVKLGADFSGVLAEDTGATWKLSDVVAMDGGGTDRRFRADMWATPDTTMVLLADASPEPAKCGVTPWCCGYAAATDGADHIEACPHRKSPPAQEAPKAEPVCCSKCSGTIGVRNAAFEQGLIKLCVPCRSNLSEWMKAQAGKPYAGPERLPKPQLAADWVEDCLPESGR